MATDPRKRRTTHSQRSRRTRLSAAETRRLFTTLLSNLPGMAYRCRNDQDWTMEFVSDGCRELRGYSPEALTRGQIAFGSLIHPDDRARVWEDTQAALGEKRPFKYTYRIVTANGDEKWVWEQGCGVAGLDGVIVAVEGFVTDIGRPANAGATQWPRV